MDVIFNQLFYDALALEWGVIGTLMVLWIIIFGNNNNRPGAA